MMFFFTEGEYILAAAEVSWHSKHSLLNNISKKVRSELSYLSASLDRNFSVDTTSNYILVSTTSRYKGMAWSSRKFDNVIAELALQSLNDNAYHDLRKFRGIAIDWFLKYEALFLQARINDSVADYWLYLEILLSYTEVKKNVMGSVSSIILINEKFIRDKRILTTIRDCFLPFSEGFRFLNPTKNNTGIQKVKPAVKHGKIAREVRKVDYPFVKELVKEYDNKMDRTYYKKAKDYYFGILTEAYEFRNFAVHNGMENEASRDKLVNTLPNIIIRLRWIIFKALKNGEHNTPFDLLLEKLNKQAELLLST